MIVDCIGIKQFIFNQLDLLFFKRKDQLILFRTFITRRDYQSKNHNTFFYIKPEGSWLRLCQLDCFEL